MSSGSETEKKIHDLLHKEFDAEHVVVQDISGGCGAMYTIQVVSSEFEGKNRVAQHRMVNEVSVFEVYQKKIMTLKGFKSRNRQYAWFDAQNVNSCSIQKLITLDISRCRPD